MMNISGLEHVSIEASTPDGGERLFALPRFQREYCLLYAQPRAEGLHAHSTLQVTAPDHAYPALPPPPALPCDIVFCWFTPGAHAAPPSVLPALIHAGVCTVPPLLTSMFIILEHIVEHRAHSLDDDAAGRQLEALLYALMGYVQRHKADTSVGMVEKALRYMRSHLTQNIGLADICREAGVSREHFIRTFKKNMHMPPMKYLGKLRLRQATDLLLAGLSVREVADKLNFYNESHFGKMFKRQFGVTPRTYKLTSIEQLREHKRQSEIQLHLTVSLLSEFIDAIPDFFFIKDTDFITQVCNQAYCNFVGHKKEHICGKNDYELFPASEADFFRSTDKATFTAGRSMTFRRQIMYPDGHRVLMETTKTPYLDKNGALLGLVCVGRAQGLSEY